MIIIDPREIGRHREQVREAARGAVAELSGLLGTHAALAVLEEVRFNTSIGRDPLGRGNLNLVEQLNQTFTILASLAATEWLFVHEPSAAPFTLNLGPKGGHDVLGRDGSLVAEVFAAVRPGNNQKLKRDIERVAGAPALRKYVFYYRPDDPGTPPEPGSTKRCGHRAAGPRRGCGDLIGLAESRPWPRGDGGVPRHGG